MPGKLNRLFATPATNHAAEIIGMNFWIESRPPGFKLTASVENLALTTDAFFPI
jgi:hypothetical protein